MASFLALFFLLTHLQCFVYGGALRYWKCADRYCCQDCYLAKTTRFDWPVDCTASPIGSNWDVQECVYNRYWHGIYDNRRCRGVPWRVFTSDYCYPNAAGGGYFKFDCTSNQARQMCLKSSDQGILSIAAIR